MGITAKTKICLIIGDPVEHSLSPALHNAGYKALGIEDDFVFLASQVKIEDVEQAVQAARTLGIRGLTCTMPHKIEVMKYIDATHPVAKEIGAVNTVVNNDGVLTGYNTDWLGILRPLEKVLGTKNLKGKNLVLFGAGGAARAVAYATKISCMNLRIVNRTYDTAQELAREFGGIAYKQNNSEAFTNVDIFINSTSVGMGELEGQSLLPIEYISQNSVVFDCIYKPVETLMIKDARMVGAKTISGYEMLLYQGLEQFKIYTGQEAPEAIMREVLEKNLGIRK